MLDVQLLFGDVEWPHLFPWLHAKLFTKCSHTLLLNVYTRAAWHPLNLDTITYTMQMVKSAPYVSPPMLAWTRWSIEILSPVMLHHISSRQHALPHMERKRSREIPVGTKCVPTTNEPDTRIITPRFANAQHCKFSTTCTNLSSACSPASMLRMLVKVSKISSAPVTTWFANLITKQ